MPSAGGAPAAARRSSEWAASTADETNFLDPASTAYLVSEEREVRLAAVCPIRASAR